MTFTQINLHEQTQTRHSCSAPPWEKTKEEKDKYKCLYSFHCISTLLYFATSMFTLDIPPMALLGMEIGLMTLAVVIWWKRVITDKLSVTSSLLSHSNTWRLVSKPCNLCWQTYCDWSVISILPESTALNMRLKLVIIESFRRLVCSEAWFRFSQIKCYSQRRSANPEMALKSLHLFTARKTSRTLLWLWG